MIKAWGASIEKTFTWLTSDRDMDQGRRRDDYPGLTDAFGCCPDLLLRMVICRELYGSRGDTNDPVSDEVHLEWWNQVPFGNYGREKHRVRQGAKPASLSGLVAQEPLQNASEIR